MMDTSGNSLDNLYDANFIYAVEIVLRHEGGFSDSNADRGGVTNFGISLKFLERMPDGDLNSDELIDKQDIKQLNREQAMHFYWREFWHKHGYSKLQNCKIAAKILDLAVNMGSFRAHRLLQQALRAVGQGVTIDGALGPLTIENSNSADQNALLAALRSESAGFYRLIASRDPSQSKFLNGWLKRAYA